MIAVQPLLVVDDEALIRIEVIDTLQTGGYTVAECTDGASAMSAIDDSTELHGLITDVRMGQGPNGWLVACHARQKFPNIAVIYITGDSTADWTVKGVPNSVVMQKPFAASQLLTAIATMLIDAGPQPAPESPSSD